MMPQMMFILYFLISNYKKQIVSKWTIVYRIVAAPTIIPDGKVIHQFRESLGFSNLRLVAVVMRLAHTNQNATIASK